MEQKAEEEGIHLFPPECFSWNISLLPLELPVLRPLGPGWDLHHELPYPQSFGLGLNYIMGFPGFQAFRLQILGLLSSITA